MSVREARAEDIPEICSLIEEHARFEGKDDLLLDRDEMTKHLFGDSPKAWVLIAETDQSPQVTQGGFSAEDSEFSESKTAHFAIAGFAFCSWNFSTWEGQPGIWLDDLFIRPDYRRSGFGAELLQALRARTEGR